MIDLNTVIHSTSFYEFTALLTVAGLCAIIGTFLKQPIVVSFIAVGVLAGPSAFSIVQSHENIELLAKLGITILLFLVGLKLDLKLIRTLGIVSLATGLGQVFFTSAIGFLIGLALGLDFISSLYIAVALTFSSTIIIVKLLSDKKEEDSLHGKIAIGFLIVQDIVVIVALMVLSTMGIGQQIGEEDSLLINIAMVLFFGVLLLGFVMFFIRYIANPLMNHIGKSPELMVIFVIAWAALLAVIGDYVGLSMELGGLLAGISLASTPFREAIIARLSSLRDFLLLFFFVNLGTQLDLGLMGEQLIPALIFSVFVLIGNPLIVMIIMGTMGYRKRTGFLAGLTVAQISEFSLIFVAMGVTLGHVNSDMLGLTTLVGLITIALSVYMITYSHPLYRLFEPFLGIFEKKETHKEQEFDTSKQKRSYDVILFGLGRYGRSMADGFVARGKKVLAVDFNPEAIREWRKKRGDAIYGDACDPEFFQSLPLKKAEWVISALPQSNFGLSHEDPRLIILQALKENKYQGGVAIAVHSPDDIEKFTASGATKVLTPFDDAAERAVSKILGRSNNEEQ
ncbi:MAG: cation:proton antiporter [Alphaproteobacteria bacterium]